jgi:MFS family permease
MGGKDGDVASPLTTGSDAPAPPDDARIGTFAALRVRNYRLFFISQIVSNTGTWMQRIAQDWLVLELTNSPLAVGATTALQFLPSLLLGLAGGVIADRYPRRALLLATQAILGSLAAVFAVLIMTGNIQVGHIYVLALCLGLVTVVDTPVRKTFVNELVPTPLVRNAISLNSGTFQLARFLGPAAAGALISWIGTGPAFACNGISFLATICALAMMRKHELVHAERAARQKGQIREGLRYVRGQPHLKWTIVLVFFIGTFGYNWAITLSAYTQRELHAGAGTFGMLNTVFAVGTLFGAYLSARRQRGSLAALFSAAVLFGTLTIVLGAISGLWLFIGLLAVTGTVAVGFNTMANTIAQLESEPQFRGRVMSLHGLALFGGTPLGAIVVGAITEQWGPRTALIVSGGICVLATLIAAVIAPRQRGSTLHDDIFVRVRSRRAGFTTRRGRRPRGR